MKTTLTILADHFHQITTETELPNWLRSLFAHTAELCDIAAGNLTFSELREMYREMRLEIREQEATQARALVECSALS